MLFLKSLSPKVWLVIILSLIITGVAWQLHSNKREIDGLKKEAVVDQVTIASQKDIIVTNNTVAKVNEVTHVEVQKAVAKTEVAQQQIKTTLLVKENKVSQQFESKPATLENEEAKQDQLSEVRLEALWTAYCEASPDSEQCQNKYTAPNH